MRQEAELEGVATKMLATNTMRLDLQRLVEEGYTNAVYNHEGKRMVLKRGHVIGDMRAYVQAIFKEKLPCNDIGRDYELHLRARCGCGLLLLERGPRGSSTTMAPSPVELPTLTLQ